MEIVEQHRPRPCPCEQPGAPAHSAREPAALVTEDVALSEARPDFPGRHFYEVALAAAQLVEGARKERLPGPSLSHEHDWRLRRGIGAEL